MSSWQVLPAAPTHPGLGATLFVLEREKIFSSFCSTKEAKTNKGGHRVQKRTPSAVTMVSDGGMMQCSAGAASFDRA